MLRRKLRLLPVLALAVALLGGGLATPPPLPHHSMLNEAIQHSIAACRSRLQAGPNAASSSAHLTYYGGPVISSVKLVMVLYGTGTYASFISNDTAPSMKSFFTQVVQSPYLDWLSEYNTPDQTIGRGTFLGKFQITPSPANSGASLTDAQIRAELQAQLQAGNLPAADANTLYVFHFPVGTSIEQGGSFSCRSGGFCGYHGTAVINSKYVYYAVLPDISTGACNGGCGGGSAFQNQCSVASHELCEAITDPAVGAAQSLGPPLGWYDNANGEIGDICNANHGLIKGSDGNTYTVQKLWSNTDNHCIRGRPVATSQSVPVAENTATGVTLTGTEPVYPAEPLSFALVGGQGPTHGMLSGTGANQTYTPNTGYSGPDSFQFTVIDTDGATSAPATVTLNVAAGYTWQPVDLAVGSDNKARLLWNNVNSAASVWVDNGTGTFPITYGYGPYPGWTAVRIAVGSDGYLRILWNKSDGTACIWVDNGTGTYPTIYAYGPYPGWSAADIAVGGDNHVRLLWTNADGTASIWIDDGTNTFPTRYNYGPYPGWTAAHIAVGTDGYVRILWNKTDGTACIWVDNGTGTFPITYGYGPYPGWTAAHIAVGTDGYVRILWNKTDGTAYIWVDNGTGTFPITYGYGPFPGWSAARIAVGGDGYLRMLWTNANGAASVWVDNGTGTFPTAYNFGPF